MSQKDQQLKTKFTFDISKFKFQNGLKPKTSYLWAFLRQAGVWEITPPKNVQVFLQVLNPVKNAEMLAPELVGVQIKMWCHTFVTHF